MSTKFRIGFRTDVCVGQMSVSDRCLCRLTIEQMIKFHFIVSACMNLIKGMLQPDPCKRLKLTAVMQHPWVTNKGTWPLYPFIAPKTNEILEKQVNILNISRGRNSSMNFTYGKRC